MKLEADLIDKLVRDAVSHGITKTKEIIAHVREEIMKAAKDFKCTTVLTKEASKILFKGDNSKIVANLKYMMSGWKPM